MNSHRASIGSVQSWLIMGIVLSAVFAAEVNATTWRAGAATTNITPEVGVWMAGYGDRNHPAEGKRTDLWAKVLCLEDAVGERFFLVTLDLVGIDRMLSQSICEQMAQRVGCQRRQIAICCSHTHTGPVVGGNLGSMHYRLLEVAQQERVAAYAARLPGQIADTAARAVSQLASCSLTWGRGRAAFAVNRRANREPDVALLRTSQQLVGPVDHEVPVLAVRSQSGSLQAVVFGYACHATVLNDYQWSGDYPGFAQLALERDFPGCVALFWAGCGADQNPLPRRDVEYARQYGYELAGAVKETLERPMTPIHGSLRVRFEERPLDLDALPTQAELEADARAENRFVASRAKMLLEQVASGQLLSSTYPFPLGICQLGDQVEWVFLGGEVVVDYALRLKRDTMSPALWVTAYANDVMAYVPSRRVWLEGGYEGAGAMVYYGLPSRWSDHVETQLLEHVDVLRHE